MIIIQSFEANQHRLTLEGDDIIRVYSRGNVTEEGVQSVFNQVNEITGGKKALMLIDPTEEKSMTKEGRKMIKLLGEKHCLGMAVITRKEHVKRIANILMKIDGPKFPLKMFTVQEEATNWLKCLQTSVFRNIL